MDKAKISLLEYLTHIKNNDYKKYSFFFVFFTEGGRLRIVHLFQMIYVCL